MNYRVVMAALAAALLALLPVLYLYHLWPTVLAFVPTHYSLDSPDLFVGRQLLWNVVWFPAIARAILTFLPQVRNGANLFWSSPQQRYVRFVAVALLVVFITLFVHNGAQGSRAARGQPPRPAASGR